LDDKAAFEKVDAPCRYFGSCGGCAWQDLAYADQLALKRARLVRLLDAVAPPAQDVDVEGLDAHPWRYRNKAEFTFGSDRGQIQLGFHAAGSYWRVVDLDDCLLLPEPMSRLLSIVRGAAQRSGAPVYSPRSHQGFFRFLVVRSSRATGKILACLVTAPGAPSSLGIPSGRAIVEGMAEAMLAHPDVASVFWGISAKSADVASPEELIHLRGEHGLDEQVGPFSVHLPPLAFLQPSLKQAERLYARLSEWLPASPDQTAWDLYCGIGLVGFYLSKTFGKVYGIDCEPSNIEAARLNAARNNIRNIEFHLGPAEDVLANKRFWLVEAKPDVIVVDPPRGGLHASALSSVLSARPKQIVYVSCNPHALARDLATLTASFPRYRVSRLAAFDFFPQTAHLETLTLLER
jgi:23S rRNA (uracil1939-C5)-methyltransferase